MAKSVKRRLDFSDAVHQDQPTVISKVPIEEPAPQAKAVPMSPNSPPSPRSSLIHIDSKVEEVDEAEAEPPREGSRDTSSWLENILGRKRKRPSYQLNFARLTVFTKIHQ